MGLVVGNLDLGPTLGSATDTRTHLYVCICT